MRPLRPGFVRRLLRRPVRLLPLLVAPLLALGTLQAAPAAAATGTITGLAGKCMDVAGGSSANGTAVQLYDCNGSARPAVDGRTATAPSVPSASAWTSRPGTADGAKVQLWDCTGGGNQKWNANAAHDIVNTAADKCLDVTGQQLGQQHPAADLDLRRHRQPEVDGARLRRRWRHHPVPAPMAVAPYLYKGWGSPPNPTTVMNATGVKWFTMAFVLSNGYCNPQWDGGRPLTGGVDQQTINTIRGAGGDVVAVLRRLERQQAGELLLQRGRTRRRLPEGDQRLRAQGHRHRHRGRRLQRRRHSSSAPWTP